MGGFKNIDIFRNVNAYKYSNYYCTIKSFYPENYSSRFLLPLTLLGNVYKNIFCIN